MFLSRIVLRLSVVALSCVAAITAHASDWKGKGELGLVLARGNTNNETINAKADMTTETDPWKHLIGFSALRSTTSDVLTGDRYEFHGQSDYKLSAQGYALGSVRYENDTFSPYNYTAVTTVGYGYKFFDTEITKLETELGVGYRRTRDRLTGDTQGDAIVRGGMNYQHKLTTTSDVYDKFLVEAGSDNTYLQNEMGIKVSMNSSLALSVAHQIRHNSRVNENAVPTPKKTDQLLTVNLVFAF